MSCCEMNPVVLPLLTSDIFQNLFLTVPFLHRLSFFSYPRPMNFPPLRALKCCYLWPVRQATSTLSPHGNFSQWSPARRARRWSRHAWILLTPLLGRTQPAISAWVLRALRKRTLRIRCLSRTVAEKQRYPQFLPYLVSLWREKELLALLLSACASMQ